MSTNSKIYFHVAHPNDIDEMWHSIFSLVLFYECEANTSIPLMFTHLIVLDQ